MSTLSDLAAKLKSSDLERALGLRPPYPPVALELNREEVILVRMKPRRRGRPLLEAHEIRPLPEQGVPMSIFQPVPTGHESLSEKLRDLFETTGTRIGRASLILPDNLSKITLMTLPERPASRKQLDELVRSKMRRAVPFRIEDASLTYQVFAGEGREISVLVVLVRRALIERLEQAFGAIGVRPGLIDICTPNLLNLCRPGLVAASAEEGDAALLNCSQQYFSLVIVRKNRLIFFRCKTFAPGDDARVGSDGSLTREVATSFAYYKEKLAGQGVRTVYVRSTTTPVAEIAAKLRGMGCEVIEPVDPAASIDLGPGVVLEPGVGQIIAPAVGAAVGRS